MKLFWYKFHNFIQLQLLFLLQLMFVIQNTYGANILIYIGGISTPSHQHGLEPLANKLADRGHNVTFFTPFQPQVQHPTVKYFCTTQLLKFKKAFAVEYGVLGLKSRVEEKYSVRLLEGSGLFDSCYMANEMAVRNTEFKLWSEQNNFDLIILDATCNEAAFGLAHKYKAKIILYTPIAALYMWDYDLFGIPPESSWFPTSDNNYEGKMGLLARMFNAYSAINWHLKYKRDYLPKIDKLIRDEMEVDNDEERSKIPPLINLVRETQLILSSQHFSDQFAKSLPPFVVPVGGMHLEQSSGKLDKELEQFVGGSVDGFIYISFGSIVTISSMPNELRQVFFEALQSFKNLRFLWKWEGPLPENVPENVLFKPWFKQKDVLAHPKIRGFISQGGQVSIQEAIFNAVPLIVFPVNGDQDMNAKRIRYAGNGLELEFCGLTSAELKTAVTTLLTDKKYAETSRLLSKITRDRPMSALDTGVWWTEYILRNDNNTFLKPVSFHQQWWETRLIDVWALITFTFTSCVLMLFNLLAIFKRVSSTYLYPSKTTDKRKKS